MEETPFSSLEEMLYRFGQSMSEQSDSLQDDHELLPGRGLVKTYLLEADRQGEILELLSRFQGTVEKRFERHVVDQPQPTQPFLRIRWQERAGADESNQWAYVDASSERMWRLYSTSPSDLSDKLWRRLRALPFLDSTWLPKQFLTRLSQTGFGFMTGLTSKFSRKILVDDFTEESLPALSLKMWGSKAQDVLSALEQAPQLNDGFTLTGIRLRFYGDRETSAHDDIAFDGKVTSWGKSMESHQELLFRVFNQEYLSLLNTLEERFSIRDGDDMSLSEPAFIRLSSEVESVSQFLKELVGTSAANFRLLGIEDILSDDFGRLLVVDKHVGRSFTLEMTRSSISILLPPNACGNTLLRLLTILQQDFDPAAELVDANNARILS